MICLHFALLKGFFEAIICCFKDSFGQIEADDQLLASGAHGHRMCTHGGSRPLGVSMARGLCFLFAFVCPFIFLCSLM